MELSDRRLETYRFLKMTQGLFAFSLNREDRAEIVVRQGEIRRQPHRLLQMRRGLVPAAGP